jgi:hypothetical protein
VIAARIKGPAGAGSPFLLKLSRAEAQLVADALAIVRPDSDAAAARADRMALAVEALLRRGARS